MKKYVLIILAIVCFMGCENWTRWASPPTSRSFVQGYYEIDNINLQTWSKVNFGIYGTKDGKDWEVFHNDNQSEKYDALCQKHNDMTWNGAPYWRVVLGVDFSSIEVVSNSDFDENHLAGSSLADILRFESKSVYPFLKKESGTIRNPHTDIFKPLSDLTTDDMVMLGYGVEGPNKPPTSVIAYFTWLSEPTLSKTHNITVTMTADDGRIFEKSINISWE